MRAVVTALILSISLGAQAADPPGAAKTPDKSGASKLAESKKNPVPQDAVRTLQWEELIPAGYRPDEIFKKFARRAGKMKDDDPRAKELQQELMTAWSEAPVVGALDGKRVKLPGYVVPLEGDGDKKITEFLLVPYFGACIHVPPPPSNQIVYVKADTANAKVHNFFDTVMITGTLRTTGTATALAAAGYVLEATKVEAY